MAECGCDHLLDLVEPQERLSWLTRYREPMRRELGLPLLTSGNGQKESISLAGVAIETMIDQSQNFLKQCEGWIV